MHLQLVIISCHYLLIAQCKCEVKISSNLTASALCKEDDELRKMVDNWSLTAQKLEGRVQEMVIYNKNMKLWCYNKYDCQRKASDAIHVL